MNSVRVDEWMASVYSSCVVWWNGGGVCCAGPPQSSVCGLCHLLPARTVRVLRSCHALSVAGVWCSAVCVCVVFVWWGILCLPPPPCRGGGGGHCAVGWHDDGRAAVLLAFPFAVDVPRSVRSVAVLNGGGGGVCDAPSLDWVRRLVLSYSLSRCPTLPVPYCVLSCLLVGKCGGVCCLRQWCVVVVRCCDVRGKGGACCGWRSVLLRVNRISPPSSSCVRRHVIVGLVLRFSVRVVSLWNGGDGLCGGWNGGGAMGCVVSLSVSSRLFLFLFFFSLRAGVRGSARAALRARTLSPNTIVFPLFLLSAHLVFLSFAHPPFFTLRLSCYCGMAGGGSPCVGVLCWHDGYG